MVIKFIEENTVETVPTNWILGDQCYWPPYADKKILLKALKGREASVSDVWQLFNVSYFRNNVFSMQLFVFISKLRKINKYFR